MSQFRNSSAVNTASIATNAPAERFERKDLEQPDPAAAHREKQCGHREPPPESFVSVKQQWLLYLSTIDPLFFHESMLEKDGCCEMGRRTGGRSAYTTERSPHLHTRAHGAQELEVIIEKRQRISRLPNVLFPSLTFWYV
jgi:hypothetical protein